MKYKLVIQCYLRVMPMATTVGYEHLHDIEMRTASPWIPNQFDI